VELNDIFESRTELSTLTEGVKYETMFAALMPYCNENLAGLVNNAIQYARKNFKRSDIITWFLRYYRLQLAKIVAVDNDKAHKLYTSYFNQIVDKKEATAVAVNGSAGQIYANGTLPNYVSDTLIHYLHTPVPEIENYRFGFDAWSNIDRKFLAWENEWKKGGGGQLIPFNPKDDAKVIIDFKDGFAWYLLNRAYCPAEAAAMGHCGNGGRELTSDRILSLRQKITKGDRVYVRPALTFILREDGKLTEMKGRGNEKPAQQYHKYVLALLQNKIITGIRGGGYKPQNNFAMSDLDHETRENLITERPHLGDLKHRYEKLGPTNEHALDELQKTLDDHGFEKHSILEINVHKRDENQNVIIKEYPSLEQFCTERDHTLKPIVKIASGGFPRLHIPAISDEDMRSIASQVLSSLSEKEFLHVKEECGMEPQDTIEDMLNAISKHNDNSFENNIVYLTNRLTNAARRSMVVIDSTKEKLFQRILRYLKVGFFFEVPGAFLDVGDLTPETLGTNPVYFKIPLKSIYEIMINASSNSGDMALYDIIGEHGWEVDNDAEKTERRAAAGLLFISYSERRKEDKMIENINKKLASGSGRDLYRFDIDSIAEKFRYRIKDDMADTDHQRNHR
jgi:hypothetical protein